MKTERIFYFERTQCFRSVLYIVPGKNGCKHLRFPSFFEWSFPTILRILTECVLYNLNIVEIASYSAQSHTIALVRRKRSRLLAETMHGSKHSCQARVLYFRTAIESCHFVVWIEQALPSLKSRHGRGHSDRKRKRRSTKRNGEYRRESHEEEAWGGYRRERTIAEGMRERDRYIDREIQRERERGTKLKKGGGLVGAWNPVISATKRAVHLAGR